ncbi:hypothetical protein C3L33_00288, partial [Rhododendron williamsianum]
MEGRSCSNRFLLWLLLLTLWTYAAFYVQYLYPRSVRKDDHEAFLDYARIGKPDDHGNNSESEENNENSLRIAKRGRNSTTYGLILGPFLSKKGGLMPELVRRKIKVVEDNAIVSSKLPRRPILSLLDQRSALLGLSQQWLTWCAEENVDLKPTNVSVVPLSVNDELAFVAGIPCSLNTPSSGPETMLEKRKVLRNAVREEMGLKDSDVVVMSLSSINGGKGQLLLLEAAQMVVEKELSGYDPGSLLCKIAALLHPFAAILAQLWFFFFVFYLKHEKREDETVTVGLHNAASEANVRTEVSQNEGVLQEQTLKVLIGSVGSKSNELPYVKAMLSFIYQHPNLSNSVLWTPATTRVAALYSAADVYVTNSQVLFSFQL